MVEIAAASPSALPRIKSLLSESGLPSDDLTEQHLRHFLVALDGDDVVGGIGLEPVGPTALLRSLVVAPRLRGSGLGTLLASAAEAKAASDGLRYLYLLTTTAEGFFARRGYRAIERASAPDGMRQTVEFREACPQTAVCMTRALPAQ